MLIWEQQEQMNLFSKCATTTAYSYATYSYPTLIFVWLCIFQKKVYINSSNYIFLFSFLLYWLALINIYLTEIKIILLIVLR